MNPQTESIYDDTEKYNLYWFDCEGNKHCEIYASKLDDLFRSRIQTLLAGPAQKMGIVDKVLVTDVFDMTNFLWEKGQGIVFPRAQA